MHPPRRLRQTLLLTLLAALSGCDLGKSTTLDTGAGAVGGSAGSAASGGSAGSSSTTAGTDGAAASGGTSAAGAASGSFVPAWSDEFDTLDSTAWQLQTFSWEGNLAQFSTENADVAAGILSIRLTPEPGDAVKPFRGVELRSLKTLTYGKVEARMRFARGSGVVSGLVLIYTPWPADDWNEIDIEHLGNNPSSSQLNCQVYLGPPTQPPVAQSVTPTSSEQIVDLGFDAEADFHVYGIEWTPAEVRFTIDGALTRTWTQEIARMKLPQNVLLTIWASNAAGWAGPILPDTAPTSAEIDWIHVYDWAE